MKISLDTTYLRSLNPGEFYQRGDLICLVLQPQHCHDEGDDVTVLNFETNEILYESSNAEVIKLIQVAPLKLEIAGGKEGGFAR